MHANGNINRMTGRDRSAAVLLAIIAGLTVMTLVSALHPPTQVTADPRYRIDVNTAQISELQLLPNVGPAISAAIIAERESGGLFKDVNDMQRVRGIGPGLVRRFEGYVSFSDVEP